MLSMVLLNTYFYFHLWLLNGCHDCSCIDIREVIISLNNNLLKFKYNKSTNRKSTQYIVIVRTVQQRVLGLTCSSLRPQHLGLRIKGI